MRRVAHLFAAALQLLTRLPVRVADVTDEDLRAATAFFPIIGLVVATTGIAVRGALDPALGRGAATVGAVAAMIAVTGAFHEDGLADSVDGLWGGWTPERRVEIMRDSRVGTYGALALILSVAFRIALLAPLALREFASVVILGHVLGRFAGVVLAATARPISDHGMGAKVVGPNGAVPLAVAAATAVVAAAGSVGAWLALPLGTVALVVGGAHVTAHRRLGGVTGDILGATNQIAHLAVMAVAVTVLRTSH